MTTLNHQWLARLFVSDAEINQIMAKNKINEPTENVDEKDISPPIVSSSDIEMVIIKRLPLFKGNLLIIKDPSRVSLAAIDKFGGAGMMITDLVKKNNAIAGINASGFADENGHGIGGTPFGLVISNKNILQFNGSSNHSIIGLDKNNILVLGSYSDTEIKHMGIRDAVSFSPFLVVNGKPMITEGNGGWGLQPRTAIGQRRDGAILMLVIDGRQPQIGCIGATLKDVQDIMLKYGAYNVANLDGGSSTTMVYKDEIVNNPCSSAGPRPVPDAFIVK
jgi:exopolysaccharide biosynthesis protein